MAYVTAEARQGLLDDVAQAIEELGVALAALGAAYEALDEASADRLEEGLFRPVQAAYGRAQRTHAAFAERYGLRGRSFAPASAGLPSQGVKGFLERAVDAIAEADTLLAELQDSMAPVEVGDEELRAGLAQVRALLADLQDRAALFVSRFGR
ncbi:MAG: hypothetical protein QOK21_733 [Solirubrobacteraceae bacterium]|jgi:hypothetical protein|nr:hypothetical protein [Solirubrobacteraceae bacterium]